MYIFIYMLGPHAAPWFIPNPSQIDGKERTLTTICKHFISWASSSFINFSIGWDVPSGALRNSPA
jgi:hypothetical protein